MTKVLITPSTFNLENFYCLEEYKARGIEVVVNPYGRRLSKNEIIGLINPEVIGILAGLEPLSREVITYASGLKVISRCGVGMDNVDQAAAHDNNIRVYNTPQAPVAAVSELTIAHILSALRRISESDRNMRNHVWNPLYGNLLKGKLLGIIGFGRIGQAVAKLAEAFGVRIIAHDPYVNSDFEEIEFVSLAELLSSSDIVSLHVPYDESMHHLINGANMSIMKETALLVNVSRGGLIDEDALYYNLLNKNIAGAALDCFENEPYTGKLITLENVQLTSHMGSYAIESRTFMESEAAVNLYNGLKESGFL